MTIEQQEEQSYTHVGHQTRYDYLNSLAEEYGEHVHMLADVLGPDEDFDGLITTLEDYDEDFGNEMV